MSAWRVRGLVVDRPPFRLGPVDVEVAHGTPLAVIGRSGAGKTTLLRALAGLLDARAGSIERDGEEVRDAPPDRRRAVYVPAGLGLFPHLSVLANLRYPGRVRGLEDEAALRAAVRSFGLERHLDRRPQQLSEGERQKVAAARALLAQPSLLLWDEPLGALDAAARRELLDLLRQVAGEGATSVVVVTHDPETAFSLAGRFLVLDRGIARFTGPAGELGEHPPDGFVARFLGYDNVWDRDALHRVFRAQPLARLLDRCRGPEGLCFPAPRPAAPGDVAGLVAEVRRIGPGPRGFRIDAEIAGVPVRLEASSNGLGPVAPGASVRFAIPLETVRPLGVPSEGPR